MSEDETNGWVPGAEELREELVQLLAVYRGWVASLDAVTDAVRTAGAAARRVGPDAPPELAAEALRLRRVVAALGPMFEHTAELFGRGAEVVADAARG